jgi:asparagine synthase (glutamine-hydrolysing)
MCGIAGIYNFKCSVLQEDYMQWCLHTMKHRGPDAQNIWHNNKNYITAFARLAIRDLSENGNQPMRSDDGNYCITFNGEIYNTEILAQLLKPYRTSFHSSSDTELLLYALIYLGVDETLKIVDGIFAFAFYDEQKNSLILARDRVGIKPLYIGTSKDGIVFSSQYDHIINHSFLCAETFDATVVSTYLSLGYMPENSGIVTNTKLLPHGFYLSVSEKKTEMIRYYSYGAERDKNAISLENILSNSVTSQLVSDVPVGTFMSGGVDSTLISYFANKSAPIQSFTIGVKNNNVDESETAQAFADIFKTQHHTEFISSDDLVKLLDDNAKAFTEPFADFSSLPVLMLSKFAREKVTVALSGDGGDELFWGYPRNRKALNFIPFYQKKLWARRAQLLVDKIKNRSAVHLVRHWNVNDFMEYYYSSFFITGADFWLPKICNAQPEKSFFYNEGKNFYEGKLNTTNELMQMMRKLETDIHLQRILLKVDRASMFHSLEVRVPFLSNSMLDYSLQKNYTDCIEGENGKMNLKKLLISKSRESLVLQPKKGFVIPIDEWLRKEIKDEVREKILDMPAQLSPFFNKKELEILLSKHMKDGQNWGWFIWAIYSLVKWENTHCGKYKI